MIEVELKAHVTRGGEARILALLPSLGFLGGPSLIEEDQYYNGIGRDFGETDEALRIRLQTRDGVSRAAVTYKGPKFDADSRTRKELEFDVSDALVADEALLALGFTPVMRVKKRRRVFTRGDITLCLDDVHGLGTFLELETLVERPPIEPALSSLMDVLRSLAIPPDQLERRSYLEMLLSTPTCGSAAFLPHRGRQILE